MTLVDTGPLVAVLNGHDPNHTRCVATSKHLPRAPLITTWPCLTEAMHLLYREIGFRGQAALWQMVHTQNLVLYSLDEADRFRMAALMFKYQDMPMDFADASLLVAAERLSSTIIFTLDRDFYVYRLANGSALEVVP